LKARQRPSDHLILQPGEWRGLLRDELVACGFEQDAAGVVARHVIERLVRGYLSGRLAPEPPATQPLDEAA
jgi:hypothetical protein